MYEICPLVQFGQSDIASPQHINVLYITEMKEHITLKLLWYSVHRRSTVIMTSGTVFIVYVLEERCEFASEAFPQVITNFVAKYICVN